MSLNQRTRCEIFEPLMWRQRFKQTETERSILSVSSLLYVNPSRDSKTTRWLGVWFICSGRWATALICCLAPCWPWEHARLTHKLGLLDPQVAKASSSWQPCLSGGCLGNLWRKWCAGVPFPFYPVSLTHSPTAGSLSVDCLKTSETS